VSTLDFFLPVTTSSIIFAKAWLLHSDCEGRTYLVR